MEKRNVCVTGGFGYVGSVLTPHLLSQGHAVTVIDLCLYGEYGLKALRDRPEFNKDWSTRFRFVKGDIRDPKDVRDALKGCDSVIHLAAISNDPTGEVDDVLTRQTNFDAVGVLVCLARELGVKRFINASSSSVFGIKHDANVTEQLEPEPLTAYSRYKMLSEWIVSAAASKDFCTVNIRPATICGYSPRQRFDLTVNKLTADGVQKKLITVHGGQQRRPNVGMTDVVNLYNLLLNTDENLINGRTFNFGFENLKVIEIAKLIQETLSDLKPELKVAEVFDNRDYHISSAKILDQLQYKAVSSIGQEVQTLRRAIEQGFITDVDAPQYYNMKSMKLERKNTPYEYLSR